MLIAQINRIRREHVALQSDWSLRFHTIGNEHLLAYSKQREPKLEFDCLLQISLPLPA